MGAEEATSPLPNSELETLLLGGESLVSLSGSPRKPGELPWLCGRCAGLHTHTSPRAEPRRETAVQLGRHRGQLRPGCRTQSSCCCQSSWRGSSGRCPGKAGCPCSGSRAAHRLTVWGCAAGCARRLHYATAASGPSPSCGPSIRPSFLRAGGDISRGPV